MANKVKPLDTHQQRLVNIIVQAHKNLALARKAKVSETERRIDEARIRHARLLEQAELAVRYDVEKEIEQHAAALEESVIAAYEAEVPIRRIALDGFGNRHDGAVHAMLRELRKDGRVGNRGSETTAVSFPPAIDFNEAINAVNEIQEPKFELMADPLVLVPATNPEDEVTVQAVKLTMDARDPFFREIAADARPNTPFKDAVTCTLYLHPFSGELTTHESKETGEMIWDHPIARWVKKNRDEALSGFKSAISPLA